MKQEHREHCEYNAEDFFLIGMLIAVLIVEAPVLYQAFFVASGVFQ